ncbi:redoxin domain-containing protein [Microvirga tunisiensis]|uniref:Redoxin domain-containing protein n=1 Tax=Microvirga tunisiensis TaxID=2108360 RepID=A0A5N7MXD8_9HYPH|nr:redoxin domain-containing protein [Microvirga tunisiensis]MPR13829.1 redoxin domain-containing protein [Microvirga tunisiensis]MPR31623.1 redoxin domain-containing protein [Microvirga tunisiensis]
MSISEAHPTISPGQRAPDFTLPAVDGSGTVSLADYRGRTPLFLALFVGLWCPFCRRAIAQVGMSEPALKASGIETLGIVATPPENARLYFKFRPTRFRLAADPELTTHRAFGIPKPTPTPELVKALGEIRINPDGILPEPLPIMEAAAAVAKLDGYTENDTDHTDMERQWPQLKGQFLIDRDGIVRWANVECATEGLAGVGKFPSSDDILVL